MYDAFFLSMYNMVYTSMPIIFLGTMDQDVDEKSAVRYAGLYTPGLRNMSFNNTKFLITAFEGIGTSLVLVAMVMGKERRSLL